MPKWCRKMMGDVDDDDDNEEEEERKMQYI